MTTKRFGIVVAAAVAGLLLATPAAFAEDSNNGDGGHNDQRPAQHCNNSLNSGVIVHEGDHVKYSDSHEGECHQSNSNDSD